MHQSWTSLTGSRKIAHTACVAGCGIATWPQNFRPITTKGKEVRYPMPAAGKRFLIQRAALTERRGTTGQPTIQETAMPAVRGQVDRLLARATHEQGGIPGMFWQNKSLQKALRLLAEAKPMNSNYTAPSRMRIGGALRLEVFAEVNAAVTEVAEDCDVATGSSDGWDNVSNTHFL